MADFSTIGGGRHESAFTSAASTGISVTGGAANTKGASWTELISATAFDCSLLMVDVAGIIGNVVSSCLVDIAIGGSGAEVVIASNLLHTQSTSGHSSTRYMLPISIPAGTRISCKVQGTAASVVLRVLVSLYGQGFLPSKPLSMVDTYGAATGDSGGTSVDPGGTANTLVWTQITASSARRHAGLILALGNEVNAARTLCTWILHLGIGAASAEQKIATFHVFSDDSADMPVPTVSPFVPVIIPEGTRIAVGAQCSITDATDRLLDAVVYGVS